MKRISSFTLLCLLTLSIFSQSNFVKVENGKFIRNSKTYRFIGTNFWYGPILASEGTGGNRDRLRKELDTMKSLGINNLRILVGSDGAEGMPTKLEPTLQQAPGVYNDTLFAGLDYLLMEMGKRDMVAVLYLNNSWEWSGGYGYYLQHSGKDKERSSADVGYDEYVKYAAQFADCKPAHALFYQYVRDVISRTNRYTGLPYTQDPAIMSWQIGNEPRAFSREAIPGFISWLSETSSLIRSLDSNHLISIGSEGSVGCQLDIKVWETICNDQNIDYCNIHIWPCNWGWASGKDLMPQMDNVFKETRNYIDQHVSVAQRLHKPLVCEEFGFPRDNVSYAVGTPTKARDLYYNFVLTQTIAKMDGANFWAWAGSARPQHQHWLKGDDYCGDPAHENQGWYSIFNSDKSTLKIISRAAKKIGK